MRSSTDRHEVGRPQHDKESTGRHRASGRIERAGWIEGGKGSADLLPRWITSDELAGGMKRSRLVRIVHDDDAAGPQQTCRHLEIEERVLIVVAAVDQHHIERDTPLRECAKEV